MTPSQVNYLVDELFTFQTTSITDLSEQIASELLKACKDAYYNTDTPLITDTQFDTLEQALSDKYPSLSPQITVGTAPRGRAHTLPVKMGGLIQTHTSGDLLNWINKKATYVISNKLDGNSVLLEFNGGKFHAAFTRGDGFKGKDITPHVKLMSFPKKIGLTGTVFVRAEIIIAIDKFADVVSKSKAYKNPRNTVAGMLNAIEPNTRVLPLFDLIAYQITGDGTDGWNKVTQFEYLDTAGFSVAEYRVGSASDINFDQLTEALVREKKNSRYELDGFVIDVNESNIRNEMRSSSLDPEYARKFKINALSVESTVIDVEWAISKDGYIKPTIIVEAVDLLGVTIQRATGHNAKNIWDMKICPGARVEIQRMGDVIPAVIAVTEESQDVVAYSEWFEQSVSDVVDDWAWNETNVDLVVGDQNHDAIKRQMLIHVMTMLEVDQMREGNVNKMFDAGFETFEQLLEASYHDFVGAIGANGAIAHASLSKKLQNIKLEELMVASGLFGRGIGTRKLRKGLEAVDGNLDLFSKIDLTTVEGFQDKTARKVTNALSEFHQFVTRVSDKITLAPFHNMIQGKFTGETIVFTGFRDASLKEMLIEIGAHVVDSYSKKVTIVVAKDPSENSGKLKKARENGARIIGLDELDAMIG
jgi:DNA ligase (NAD+)